jgi:hypothetical protein
MNFSLMTISELDRCASESNNDLVKAMNAKLQELIEEIESLSVWEEIEDSKEQYTSQIEYIKRLAGLPNNF